MRKVFKVIKYGLVNTQHSFKFKYNHAISKLLTSFKNVNSVTKCQLRHTRSVMELTVTELTTHQPKFNCATTLSFRQVDNKLIYILNRTYHSLRKITKYHVGDHVNCLSILADMSTPSLYVNSITLTSVTELTVTELTNYHINW